MLGAIIGDIVGSRFEFDETPKEQFTLFMDKPQCDYTDDTVMWPTRFSATGNTKMPCTTGAIAIPTPKAHTATCLPSG